MSKVKVQGFLKNVRQKEVEGDRIEYHVRSLVGYHLDEIQISTTIKNKKDLRDFIQLVSYLEPCFDV